MRNLLLICLNKRGFLRNARICHHKRNQTMGNRRLNSSYHCIHDQTHFGNMDERKSLNILRKETEQQPSEKSHQSTTINYLPLNHKIMIYWMRHVNENILGCVHLKVFKKKVSGLKMILLGNFLTLLILITIFIVITHKLLQTKPLL